MNRDNLITVILTGQQQHFVGVAGWWDSVLAKNVTRTD